MENDEKKYGYLDEEVIKSLFKVVKQGNLDTLEAFVFKLKNMGSDVIQFMKDLNGIYIGTEPPDNTDVLWLSPDPITSEELLPSDTLLDSIRNEFIDIRSQISELYDKNKALEKQIKEMKANGWTPGGDTDVDQDVLYVINEDNSIWLAEDGTPIILEVQPEVSIGNTILTEDGEMWLSEDNSPILLEKV